VGGDIGLVNRLSMEPTVDRQWDLCGALPKRYSSIDQSSYRKPRPMKLQASTRTAFSCQINFFLYHVTELL
jgi:hypothetical protein